MGNVSYPMYKGLKKPLVFKGFKGKYIYMAAGGLVLSLVLGAILTSVNFFLGAAVIIGMAVGSVSLVSHLQKTKGLYKKQRDHNILWLHQNYIQHDKRKDI